MSIPEEKVRHIIEASTEASVAFGQMLALEDHLKLTKEMAERARKRWVAANEFLKSLDAQQQVSA
ncbi:MAG: hypothetical protein RL684_1965 [Pseudomonadota bacterium]|jgi:hypothetical protein